MANPSRPTPTPASAATVQALVGEFIESKQRERRESSLADAPQRLRKILAVVAFFSCAIVWTLPSLYRPASDAPSAEREEASVRMTLFLASERVRAFATKHDRLPTNLIEAGVDSTGISYQANTRDAFEMSMDARGKAVTFRSSQNGGEFVSVAIQTLTTAR
jgi:hypothetical protein